MSGYTFNVVVSETLERLQQEARLQAAYDAEVARRASISPSVLAEFYDYQPVPDDHSTTRVLALAPGSGSNALKGSLMELDLEGGQQYKALSYVWGQGGPGEAIFIDGKKLAITSNLATALRHFRSPSDWLWVWVDQVCINQRDTIERSKQVRLMYLIYKNASEVLAWLGPDTDGHAAKAFSLASALLAILNDDLLTSLFKKAGAELAWIPYKHWKCLKQLCEVEWFRRVWIPQEIGTNARASVHWGDESMDWELLCDAMHKLDGHPDLKRYHDIHSSPITSLHRRFLPEPNGTSEQARANFVNQLCLSAKTHATDPRDHVFSLLGHYSAILPGGMPIIQPDYDNSVQDIYHEIAIRVLKTSTTLVLLNAASDGGRSASGSSDAIGLPSWVPRWNSRKTYTLLGLPGKFKASGTTKSSISFDKKFQQLSLRGTIIDNIKKISEGSFPRSATNPLLSRHILAPLSLCVGSRMAAELSKGAKLSREVEYAPATGCATALEAFLDTMAPRAIVSSFAPTTSAYKSGLAAMEKWFPSSKKTLRGLQAASPDDGMEGNATAWLRVAEKNAHERRVAVTSSGYFVMAPPAVRKGDLVCILFGGETPYVLRRSAGAENEYQFIGEAYVNGLMNGEAIGMVDAGVLSEEAFKIR